MKQLFYLLIVAILAVFTYSCSTSMPMNEDEKELAKKDSYRVINTQQGIDSIVMVSFEGEVYQEVYYANGDMQVFQDYLEIEDIKLRESYMTYRNLYWEDTGPNNIAMRHISGLSDVELMSLKEYLGDEELMSVALDKILFNKYLILDGQKPLKCKDYNAEILGEEYDFITSISEYLGMIVVFLIIIGLVSYILVYVQSKREGHNTS